MDGEDTSKGNHVISSHYKYSVIKSLKDHFCLGTRINQCPWIFAERKIFAKLALAQACQMC